MNVAANSLSDSIRKHCWDEAVYAYGTAYIFEQRANKYRWLLRILAFLGIAVPLTIGSIFLSFNSHQQLLTAAIIIAGILGTVQLIISAWSLVARWGETYSYALESLTSNYRLADRFSNLAKYPPLKESELQAQFDLLQTENFFRSEQDNKQGITDKEKRKGMRSALRKFQRTCAGCGVTPLSMKPTSCEVCGNF